MSQGLDLKQILLTKINNVLNPNYVNKFITLTFTLGAALIGKNFLIELLLSFELITADFVLKMQLSDGASSTVFYVGGLLVFISLWLFYKAHLEKENQSRKPFRTLKKATPTLIKLMEENDRIFKECGPNSSQHHQEDLRMDFSVWRNARKEIIVPNNNKIYQIISTVKKYSPEEKRIIDKMKSHIEHFKVHVEKDDIDYSNHQFPQEFADLIYSYKKVSRAHQKKIDELSGWLESELTGVDLESVYLFGSFLYNDNYHDIDVLIKTNSSTYADIKKVAVQLKELSSKCKTDKGEGLHLSVFSEIEKQGFLAFQSKIRNLVKVV
jgi:predicted nucleotidyltransferase